MPLSPEAVAIKKLGRSLFGKDWQSPFARMTGISRAYLQFLVSGDRPVTQTVIVAVITGLRAEVKKHHVRANEIDTLSVEFEDRVFRPGRKKWPPK